MEILERAIRARRVENAERAVQVPERPAVPLAHFQDILQPGETGRMGHGELVAAELAEVQECAVVDGGTPRP